MELAIKDALRGTAFDMIDEMLLRLYYLYEKFPKKFRELEEIISDLKVFFFFILMMEELNLQELVDQGGLVTSSML